MSPTPSSDVDRVRGLVLGAAVGDALGWPQEDRSNIIGGQAARHLEAKAEFRTWARHSGGQYAKYEETVRAGEYSDDTQLLLAVARACDHQSTWTRWLAEIELPFWPTYQRGGGRAVLSASRAWEERRPPWEGGSKSQSQKAKVASYFNAGANGVAMRIAPHVAVTAAVGHPQALLERVLIDGSLTHGHPRALLGACVHALGLRQALRQQGTLGYGDLLNAVGEDESWRDDQLLRVLPPAWHEAYQQVHGVDATTGWKATVDQVLELLSISSHALRQGALANDGDTLRQLGCTAKAVSGSGTVSAVAALHVATRAAARPQSGLLRTAFLAKADTDTLASMTASLLGAVHGSHWLRPLSDRVQDRDYLFNIADRLSGAARRSVEGSEVSRDSRTKPQAITDAVLKDFRRILSHRPEGPLVLPDARTGYLTGAGTLPTRANAEVRRFDVRVDDGQTLLIVQMLPAPDGQTFPPYASTSDRQRATTPTGGPRPAPEAAKAPSVDRAEGQGAGAAVRDRASGPDTSRRNEPPPPHVAGLMLYVADLEKALSFYRDILQVRSARLANKQIRIAPNVFFAPAQEASASGTAGVLLRLHVPDLQRLKERLDEAQHAYHEHEGSGATHLSMADPNNVALQVYLAHRA